MYEALQQPVAVALISGIAGFSQLSAHPGHDSRHLLNWMGLSEGTHREYLQTVEPSALRFAEAEAEFDRSNLIPYMGLTDFLIEPEGEEEVTEESEFISEPEPEEEVELEVMIERAEPIEIEPIEAPVSQESINAVYSETGILNPDEILLYLKNVTPNEDGSTVEQGGAFRFELPDTTVPIRSEATFQRTP